MSDVWIAPAVDAAVKDAELGPALLLEVWLRPRAVMAAVLQHGGRYGVLGIGAGLGVAELSFSGDAAVMPEWVPAMVGVMVLVAPLFGVVLVYLLGLSTYAGAYAMGARPMSVHRLVAAVAWGRVPDVLTQLPLTAVTAVVWLGLWDAPEVLVLALQGMAAVGWVWSWFTTGHTVGEALGVNAARGVAATLLVGLCMSVVLMVFAGSLFLLGGFAG